jgi:cyclohexa-1,5-dienecarbonyl-CoA hydratase
MTTYKSLTVEISDGVAKITLDRPKHNVFNLEMMNEFRTELENLISDTTLKCVVIFGKGPSWCAGVEVADHKPDTVDEMISVFNSIFDSIERTEVPVIAAVHGACLGGGMEVAMACDIIIASERAVFGQPEIKLGFFPPYAAIRLPQLVGPARAVEICTTGKRYSAQECYDMGLVSSVATSEDFSSSVDRMIKEIRYSSPLIIRLNKRAVKEHLHMSYPENIEKVSDLFLNKLMKTEDTLEGIASFEQKRKPEWKNR